MRHEIGHGHVACENKGDYTRIDADEERLLPTISIEPWTKRSGVIGGPAEG
jgi:hypothetical protein